jgi:hypothetical protein
MESEPKFLQLVDPDERLQLRLGGSVLFYRRLSLGALAAIERQQTVFLPGRGPEPPQAVLPPAALEAAMLSQVLVGWQGVKEPRWGGPVEFSPQAARRLPAGVRGLLLAKARQINPDQERDHG